MGFDKPNYTQVPNLLLDVLMLDMTESELRVVLAAVRRTFGFHAPDNKAEISFSLFQSLTGLSRQSVAKGIEAAKARGVLVDVGRGRRGTVIYKLVINVDQSTKLTSQESRPELVKQVDRQLVKQVDTVKKEVKKSSKEKKKQLTRARANDISIEQKPVEEPQRPAVYALYEQNIGLLTHHIAEQLKSASTDYPAGWLEDAIKLATERNVRKWTYVRGILTKWKTNGRDSVIAETPKPSANGSAPKPTPAPEPVEEMDPALRYPSQMFARIRKQLEAEGVKVP